MDSRIGTDYIAKAIDELVATLGIKEHVHYQRFLDLLGTGRIEECIKAIASQMGLPVRVNLAYVPEQPSAANGIRFDSTSLARTYGEGQGAESITAQVSIPQELPLYGTNSLEGLPISVRISENCSNYPLTFIAIMAHELSHVLLRCLRHPQMDNEVYTDLTAMVQGFSGVMKAGRKLSCTIPMGSFTKTRTTTFGYLNDKQFEFAFDRAHRILSRCWHCREEVVRLAAELKRRCQEIESQVVQFRAMLAYLDAHRQRTARRRDSARLVEFHRPGYADRFEAAAKDCAVAAPTAKELRLGVTHYTKERTASLEEHAERIRHALAEINNRLSALDSDCRVLKRNLGLSYRIRAAIRGRRKGGTV